MCRLDFKGFFQFLMMDRLHIGQIRILIPSVCLLSLFIIVQPTYAQYGGASTVETAPAQRQVLSNFADVQGRVTSGASDAVTAFTNARIKLAPLKIGDFVKSGQKIAQQNTDKLKARLNLLEIGLTEAQLRHDEIDSDLQGERSLLVITKEQAILLASKASRARELASVNALSAEGAETALNASLIARQQVLTREHTIGRKEIQLQQSKTAMARIKTDIRQLKSDISAATLTANRSGQIIYLIDYRSGYAREGDVIARILDPADFEIEAEIPENLLKNFDLSNQIRGAGLGGDKIMLKPRVLLPVQNARTGTRTMRFTFDGDLPSSLQADNAVIVLQIPTTSPTPVVTVPKDAVLPVSNGHIVYVFAEGKAVRTPIKLGSAVADSFIVLSGLDAGQDVIIRGNEQLSDGKAVKKPGGKPPGKPAAKAKPKGVVWTLKWMSPRGESTGTLILGKAKSFFDEEEVEVVKAGDSVNFSAKKALPFGVIDLEFNGTVKGVEMNGDLVIRGLPGGQERSMTFSGSKDVN
ncbi:efflux transporter, RND family, MFP subunit [Candidatus Puniceispirillum marinum IMCC1322]|uniref:Efflux transporter, RND family, MFP subunit n=1 Tax=Puniceispirillum marinum (strain IMCC1322) TaxID=488538 RepID=D5BQ96_PUNMI|nr:efflux transporter, RND family, MFP subunit [Candidatus Puniceispirillum marinum IMCC1322]